MPKKFRSGLQVLLSIAVALFLLYLVFKNIAWADFWAKALSVDYTWVLISIGLSVIAYYARAYRWNILLEPLGYDLKASRTTLAVLIGYLANLALPRLGEITRCGILNRNENVPLPSSFGTVVSERIIDMITLLILIATCFLIEYDLLTTFLNSAYRDLNFPSWTFPVILSLGLFGTIFLIFFLKRLKKKEGKIASLVKEFLNGIASLKDIKRPVHFIISTIIIWIVYFLMSYIIVFSLPESAHLGIGAGMMLLITGGIAISLPVQSGFGTYHGMISGMLLLYAVPLETGIFLATLLHTSQIIAVALFGSVALIISFFLRRKQARTLE